MTLEKLLDARLHGTLQDLVFNQLHTSLSQISSVLGKVKCIIHFTNLADSQDDDDDDDDSIKSAVDPAGDQNVSLLLRDGFLSRTTRTIIGYQFFSPSLGKFMKSIDQGRKELLSIVKRKKDKRIPEIALFGGKVHLKQSIIHIKFHLRDLEGKGLMKRIQSTTGVFWYVL